MSKKWFLKLGPAVQDDEAIKEFTDLLFNIKKKVNQDQVNQLVTLMQRIKSLHEHEEELTRSEIMKVIGVITE
jgi:hypothetical protein